MSPLGEMEDCGLTRTRKPHMESPGLTSRERLSRPYGTQVKEANSCSVRVLSATRETYQRKPKATGIIPTVPVPTAFAVVGGASTQT
jgi:hypothetical protein